MDSPYYTTLLKYPPKDVRFTGISTEKVGVITSPKRFIFQDTIKKVFKKLLKPIQLPNLTFTTVSSIDLVHCAHCLLLNQLPWVVDIEHYWSFSASAEISYSRIGRFLIKKLLKRKYCKKIMPWTQAAANTVKKVIEDEEILNKMEVVYPAVFCPEIVRRKSRKITLLFIGRYFYGKGGPFALEVFRRLKQRYDIDCIFISLSIPAEFKRKYGKFAKIYEYVSDQYLFQRIYPSAHIFVYPGFSDTFGFALLEAMSFGIPIVTVQAFARDEIVEDGKNGFVIEVPPKLNIYRIDGKGEKLIEELCRKTALLIEDTSLRERMGKFGRRLVKDGKFSIEERNKKLRRIYEECAKR